MIHNSKLGKYFLIALMFFIANGVFGQDKKLNIEGQLALEVGSPGGAKVTVEKSGRSAGSATVASNGQFELALDFDSDYTITISQTGFVPVKYRVVTNASSDAKRDGLMPFSMPVFLVQTYTGAPDGSKIMATAKFDEVLYDFDFDKADYKSITSQKKVLLAQKSAAVAANGANAEAELKAKQEAIAKRYAEEEAARKKAEAEEERLRKEKEIQDKYDAAIAKADKAFTQSEWEYAKQFYQEASTTKPAEAYPKTKLTELENRIANEKKYTAAMEKGAAAMTAKDYTLAKTAFNEALAAKPNDAPAKGKIAEADAALAELNKQKELDSKYTALIAAADKLFVAKKWAEAKASYTEALKLKPTEEHPKTRIAESDKMIAEEEAQKANEKQLNDSYNAAITKADKLFTEKKWADAKSAYGEALALKPAEVAPKNKIKEIEALEKAEADKAAKEKELDEKFTAAISKGDAAFGSQKLAEAKAAFSEALALKPAEAYPKTKITEIDKLIAADAQKAAEEKALNDKYNAALTKGSAAFTAKKYSEAKTAYSEAASLKPSEELPKTQLAKIEELIAKDEADKAAEKQLTDQYNAAMKKGDTEFAAKNFAGARTAFNEAAGLKPAEALPKTKIKEVETAEAGEAARLAKEKETNDKYAAAVAAGDAAFATSDWVNAKTQYATAVGLKPAEAHPKNRLTEIEGKLKSEADQKAAAAALDKKYNDALALGDKQMLAKKYAEAKNAYTDASALKPAENLPKEKIAQADQLLGEMAEAARLKAEQDAKMAADEAARKKAEEDAKLAADAEAKRKAQEEADALAKQKAEAAAAAKKLADEEAAKKLAEMDAKQKAEAEAARLAAEEKARLDVQKSEEARKKAEEEAARLAAENEAKRKAQEEAQQKLNAEAAAKKAAADEAARIKAEQDAARIAAEEAARQKALQDKDAEAKRIAEENAAKLAAEEAARQKALQDKDAEAKRKAQEESARLAAEEAARQKALQDKDAEARKKAAEEEARLAADEAAKQKALQEKDADAKRKAEEAAARLAAEDAARQKALSEKNAEARKRAEQEAAALAAEEAAKQKAIADEKARRQAESAQLMEQDAQEQARLAAERKRQLEETLRLKEEEERQKKKAKAMGTVPQNKGPFVVIYKYTFATDQTYGYINMGDGTGRRDVSKAEYKSLLEKYKDYIRNIYN
jgi:hypothetical protein